MARVFIGIMAYNRPQFVAEAIRSVLGQDYPHWHAVVSDNGSDAAVRASTRRLVEEAGDGRLEFHQQPTNVGEYGQGRYMLPRARELGCDYFVILHDDDVLAEGFLGAGVEALDARPALAFFACNADLINASGAVEPALTLDFDRRHGRVGLAACEIDVLRTHMERGFTPISGAFFRTASLVGSGFVDEDMHGCVPFEINIFLRLGERGARAWFDPRRLLRYRSHAGQMQKSDHFSNEQYVRLTVQLLDRRRFSGGPERRRRQILGKLHRLGALHHVNRADIAAARHDALRSLAANPVSVSNWRVAASVYIAPPLARAQARRQFGLEAA